MKKVFQFVLLVVPMLTLSVPCFAGGAITIAGTGDSQLLLRQLAALFEEKHPGVKVVVPDSIGSGGGIKSVSAGKVVLARTARPLKEHEKKGLIELRFAVSPIVFAVHKSVQGVESISSEQVNGIYNGTISNWKEVGGLDHKIFPVDRESGDSSRSILEKYIEGFKSIKSKGKVYYTTGEAVAAIAEHEYTIGFLPLDTALSNDLKVLAIDGVDPSKENIASNRYVLLTPFYVVSKGAPTGLAAEFVTFLSSDDAKKLVKNNGLISTM